MLKNVSAAAIEHYKNESPPLTESDFEVSAGDPPFIDAWNYHLDPPTVAELEAAELVGTKTQHRQALRRKFRRALDESPHAARVQEAKRKRRLRYINATDTDVEVGSAAEEAALRGLQSIDRDHETRKTAINQASTVAEVEDVSVEF